MAELISGRSDAPEYFGGRGFEQVSVQPGEGRSGEWRTNALGGAIYACHALPAFPRVETLQKRQSGGRTGARPAP
ncbi:MAG: hypothetical protein P8X50_17610, partial [Maritimibacter sp.]